MLALGYLVLAAAVAWAVVRRDHPWLARRSPAAQQAVRAAAAALATLLAAGAVTVVVVAADGSYNVAGTFVAVAAGAGGTLYLAGALLWSGELALALRRAGFVLLAAAGALPSTLSPVLALLAPLVVTLHAPEPAGDPAGSLQG